MCFMAPDQKHFFCPGGETRKLVKVRNCVTNVDRESQWITVGRAECADTALHNTQLSGDLYGGDGSIPVLLLASDHS